MSPRTVTPEGNARFCFSACTIFFYFLCYFPRPYRTIFLRVRNPGILHFGPADRRYYRHLRYIVCTRIPEFGQANGKSLLLSPAPTIETEGLFLDVFHQDRAGAWRELHCGNSFDAGFSPYQSTRLSGYNAGP